MRLNLVLVGAAIFATSEVAWAERPFTIWNHSDTTIVELAARLPSSEVYTTIDLYEPIPPSGGYDLGFPDDLECVLTFRASYEDGVWAEMDIDTCQSEASFDPFS